MFKFLCLLGVVMLSQCQEGDLDVLLKRLSFLEMQLLEAKDEMISQDKVIRRVTKQTAVQDDLIKSLRTSSNAHKEQLVEQKAAIEAIVDHKNSKATTPIAFTAYAGAPREYLGGDTVDFEEVITNRGYNYNTDTSVFTVPQDGLYFFTTSLYALESDAVSADIMKNQEALVRAFTPDTIQRDQATAVVMAECVVGDEIYVRVTEDDGPLEGTSDAALTTFSGALIAEY